MAATEGGEDAFGSKGIEAAEGGAGLQFGEGHGEQQLGDALVGKGIANDIHAGEVEHHTFVAFKQRHQPFPYLQSQLARAQILAKVPKAECYHSSKNRSRKSLSGLPA